ncbi:hypothetical protein AAG906_001086 [Vitis piasezkii]
MEKLLEAQIHEEPSFELHSPLPKSFKVCKERTMEKRKIEDSSCSLLSFSKYGCYVMAWMQSHGNFSHPEVISYELLEGEVFNSKFCINPLEPISMAIERFVLTGRLIRWLVLLIEFDIQYFVSVTSIVGWRLYFDGAANQSRFGIGILLISPQDDDIPRSVPLAFSDHHRLTNNVVEYEACITIGNHGDSNLVIQQTQGIWRTRDEKLKPYHAYLDLLVDRFEELRYIHLPRVENQFADALATLASVIEIPTGVIMQPLLIETRSAPAYCCLIGDIEDQDELPWYHDIYQFLSCSAYPESATVKDRRALRQLATRFVICGESLYRRSPDCLLLLCLNRASAD